MGDPAPLREPTFLVLAALGPGPLHGYGIIKTVEQMSRGRVRMRAGTLYGALERLETQGYVAFDGEAAEGGPVRRYYKLTKDGESLLANEAARLQANAELAFARLGIAAR
jgi:PadR family transcriptional regulator, regulatory protein PadR